MLTLKISKDLVNAIDITDLATYVSWNTKNSQYFTLDAGTEHYKLIAYLSTLFENKNYIDIGTFYGFSALALSYDKDAKVTTYDIKDWIENINDKTVKQKGNVVCKLMDCVSDMANIIKTDFIVLDIDPHDGVEETRILDNLEQNGYRGVVLLDDINLNDDMKKFWKNIKHKKYNITKYGHWSGTGIVIFDPTRFDIETL